MHHPILSKFGISTSLKVATLLALTILAGWSTHHIGVATTPLALVSVCTFIAVICTTFFFWTQRVSVAMLGIAVLIGSHAATLKGIMMATELHIIFFLIGLMIIVGALKDLGFMTWLINGILNKKQISGPSFSIILAIFAALLSATVGEVSSIVIALALVFQVSNTLRVCPTPFVLIAVFSTNIGSAASMLGNPVGIFVGNKAGFTFNQFLLGATPIAAAALCASMVVIFILYRREITNLTTKINEYRASQRHLAPHFKLPHKRGILVLSVTLLLVAFHHQLENIFGLTELENKNALLIITPIAIAAILMLTRPKRARHYVEKEVEWWTLLFFMLLFAIAGALQEQGVMQNIADKIHAHAAGDPQKTIPYVLGISSLGSAFIDNIVFVAAFAPIIKALVACSENYTLLWWALLFGACFGGNLTIVGSTANIIAIGQTQKCCNQRISFFAWFKVGLAVTIISTLVAWGGMHWLNLPIPKYRVYIEKSTPPQPHSVPLAHHTP